MKYTQNVIDTATPVYYGRYCQVVSRGIREMAVYYAGLLIDRLFRAFHLCIESTARHVSRGHAATTAALPPPRPIIDDDAS